ncbi:MAG: hypothetical protein KDK97_07540 [Verrucomicrobiales bacterium]|nr:hypothetical protein [Verrucomicrobiales bacterium]
MTLPLAQQRATGRAVEGDHATGCETFHWASARDERPDACVCRQGRGWTPGPKTGGVIFLQPEFREGPTSGKFTLEGWADGADLCIGEAIMEKSRKRGRRIQTILRAERPHPLLGTHNLAEPCKQSPLAG